MAHAAVSSCARSGNDLVPCHFVRPGHKTFIAMAQRELTQQYPHEGWVEQNPMEIYSSQYAVMAEVLASANISAREVAAIGITNQRETTILWEKQTGQTHLSCDWLAMQADCAHRAAACPPRGWHRTFGRRPDLCRTPISPRPRLRGFSTMCPMPRARAKRGELLFGTVDTWLTWKLTGGKVHITDATNASRTMLYDIHKQAWDDTLLQALDIPREILPKVCSSSEIYGYTAMADAQMFPLQASQATSRPHCSGKPAFRLVRQKTPMAQAVFCS